MYVGTYGEILIGGSGMVALIWHSICIRGGGGRLVVA